MNPSPDPQMILDKTTNFHPTLDRRFPEDVNVGVRGGARGGEVARGDNTLGSTPQSLGKVVTFIFLLRYRVGVLAG